MVKFAYQSEDSIKPKLTNVSSPPDTQESDIEACPAIEKLSELKIAVDDTESPIMRQVFAWLFPFGPGWNAGRLAR